MVKVGTLFQVVPPFSLSELRIKSLVLPISGILHVSTVMPRLSTAYRAWIPLRWCDLLATPRLALQRVLLVYVISRWIVVLPLTARIMPMVAGRGGGRDTAKRTPRHSLRIAHSSRPIFHYVHTFATPNYFFQI